MASSLPSGYLIEQVLVLIPLRGAEPLALYDECGDDDLVHELRDLSTDFDPCRWFAKGRRARGLCRGGNESCKGYLLGVVFVITLQRCQDFSCLCLLMDRNITYNDLFLVPAVPMKDIVFMLPQPSVLRDSHQHQSSHL